MPKKSAEPLINRIPDRQKQQKQKDDNIPESEKLRLMEQAGLLKKVKRREAELKAERTSTAVYIWQAIFLSIPFGLLLGTFDITVKVQYSEPWSYMDLLIRAVKSAPALFPIIYLTNRHKEKRIVQIIMAFGSVLAGSFLMYTLRNSPSLGQMMRAPGLATIWVYFVVQMDLVPAVMTLALVAAYYYFGLHQKQK
ncbi:hypothetical protein VTP01DRAFT_3371 [Rhizomucor pusillus]|uniref:uncharacterized protein n=1 Tax=Rhizomucor pusillus TaxID=4840 RepID=UPI0037421534